MQRVLGARSRTSWVALAFATLIGLWLWAGCGSAIAVGESHPFLFSFGSLSRPNGIAIDEATGDVYVADLATSAVYKFDAEGNPVDFSTLGSNELTGSATPAKSFSFPSEPGTPAAIAVDNSTDPADPSRGDLYVMDANRGVVDKFKSNGEYLNQIAGFALATGSAFGELRGLAVDTDGTVRASLRSVGVAAIDEFDNSNPNHLYARQTNEGELGNFAGLPKVKSIGDTQDLAVGPTGDDYLLDGTCPSCVVKVGQQLAPLGKVDSVGSGDVALAADPAGNHIYIDDQSSIAEWDTGTMNGNVEEKQPGGSEGEGTLLATFGEAELKGTTGQGGIAVSGADGRIYVSNASDGKVYVFGSEGPVVAVEAATDATKEGAILNGTVNPRGGVLTSCQFDYGIANEFGQGTYEHSVPCEPGVFAVGAGKEPVEVTAKIGGLEPGLLYRFRLVAAGADDSSESAGLFATAGPGFGIRGFEVAFLNEDGTPDTQAGSHPFKMVTNILFNTRFLRKESNADSLYMRNPDGTLKNLAVDLPPGLVGDPNATSKKCTASQLGEAEGSGGNNCPPEALVGHLHLTWNPRLYYGGAEFNEPVYNIVPPHGTALELGVDFENPDLFIDNGLTAGGDYPIQATVINAPATAPVQESLLTISGVVGSGTTRKPFLTLPTGCHGPLRSTIHMESYQGEIAEKSEVMRNAAGAPVSLTGCSKLQFPPEISVAPDTTNASTASGLAVHVKVPQTAAFNPDGLAESSLRDTTVTLPEGVALNPAGADGLEACTSDPVALANGGLGDPGDQIGYRGVEELNPESEPGVKWNTFTPEIASPLQPGLNFCPNGSKIGTVKIKTPLLEHELEGAVYLAAQNANPFGSLVAMYVVAEDPFSGSLIKLPGEVRLTPTGQIVTTFKNTPDLPFEELELHFFGGERAPLSTPSRCGTYTTTAVFTPWDGNGPVTSTSSFVIDHGPNGSPCPGANLPFQPSLAAGTTSNQAGGFAPFTMTMSREDGQQNLQAVSLTMPPGLSGLLTGVQLCGEAQANAGSCGPNSLIGETTVSVGVGDDPFTVKGGKVYLTGPYKGAPFGLSIVNPAKAGPFDVEHDTANPSYDPACDCIVVRAKVEVDPHTAGLKVTSDNEGPYRIPTMLDGIPLEIKHVNVTINRSGFTFNPTGCEPQSIAGSLDSSEGVASAISVPFQATNCAALAFAPTFTAATSAKTSRTNGASVDVKLTYPPAAFGSQANIKQVKVELPKALPSRLTTLQKACTAAQFNSNPAGCPAASVVGHAKALSPLVPVPLEGPAYFVSNGGEAFPNLIVVLQGYGVTIDLVGDTFISRAGITSSTFKTIPDAPVGSFELTLPEGPYSALTAEGDLCTQKLVLPTEFVAQNGAVLHQSTPIDVTGCRPAIEVVGHSVKGKTATIMVSVPSAGILRATGTGLSDAVEKAAGRGTVTVRLTLTKGEQSLLAHHPQRSLEVRVRLRFTPKHGSRLSAGVTVLVR